MEVGPLLVLLVDEHHAGQAERGAAAPDHLGLHLDAVHRADDEDREVSHAQGCFHLAHEVCVARGVDEVDLVALPLDGRHSQRERDLALDLLGLGVRHGRTVVHTAGTGMAPARTSSASTRVVLPLPLCPTRATLRMFAVGYVFTVEDPHLVCCHRPGGPRRHRGRWYRLGSRGERPAFTCRSGAPG